MGWFRSKKATTFSLVVCLSPGMNTVLVDSGSAGDFTVGISGFGTSAGDFTFFMIFLITLVRLFFVVHHPDVLHLARL